MVGVTQCQVGIALFEICNLTEFDVFQLARKRLEPEHQYPQLTAKIFPHVIDFVEGSSAYANNQRNGRLLDVLVQLGIVEGNRMNFEITHRKLRNQLNRIDIQRHHDNFKSLFVREPENLAPLLCSKTVAGEIGIS